MILAMAEILRVRVSDRREIERAVAALVELGVRRSLAAPPVYRFLWRLGWRIRPPLFQSFGTLFLLFSTGFATFMGTFMWSFVWTPDDMSLTASAIGIGLSGVLFGLYCADNCRCKARSLRLPDWQRYIAAAAHPRPRRLVKYGARSDSER